MASRSDSGNDTRGSSESDNSPTPTPTRHLHHQRPFPHHKLQPIKILPKPASNGTVQSECNQQTIINQNLDINQPLNNLKPGANQSTNGGHHAKPFVNSPHYSSKQIAVSHCSSGARSSGHVTRATINTKTTPISRTTPNTATPPQRSHRSVSSHSVVMNSRSSSAQSSTSSRNLHLPTVNQTAPVVPSRGSFTSSCHPPPIPTPSSATTSSRTINSSSGSNSTPVNQSARTTPTNNIINHSRTTPTNSNLPPHPLPQSNRTTPTNASLQSYHSNRTTPTNGPTQSHHPPPSSRTTPTNGPPQSHPPPPSNRTTPTSCVNHSNRTTPTNTSRNSFTNSVSSPSVSKQALVSLQRQHFSAQRLTPSSVAGSLVSTSNPATGKNHQTFRPLPKRYQFYELPFIFFIYLFFLGSLFSRKLYLKNFNIKNKDNKISQGRGNSLRKFPLFYI